MSNIFITPAQVADHYPGLTAGLLARWRWAHTGPIYSKFGKQVLYQHEDIETFLNAHRVTPTFTPHPI